MGNPTDTQAKLLADVVAANATWHEAQARVPLTKAALGEAIATARAGDVPQGTIAAALEVNRETVRRYEVEWRESLPGAIDEAAAICPVPVPDA